MNGLAVALWAGIAWAAPPSVHPGSAPLDGGPGVTSAAMAELLAEADELRKKGATGRDTAALRQAAEMYRHAVDALAGGSDFENEARAWDGLGQALHLLGDNGQALHALERALLARQRTHDAGNIARAFVEVGAAQNAVGEKAKAFDALTRGLEMHRRLGDSLGAATALTHL